MSGRRLESDAEIVSLLQSTQTIAVVGLSPRPSRPSHQVASYLQESGFRIIPVRPDGESILGEPVVRSLGDLPEPPDLVDVFRRPEALPGVVEETAAIGARALWLQLGVVHPGAEAAALAAGIDLVADRCLLVEHRRLLAGR